MRPKSANSNKKKKKKKSRKQVYVLYVLPIVDVPISLRQLRSEIDEMASEQEVVLGADGEGVAHECSGVEC